MPRARNIKPGFFVNERLAEIQPLGRLLFAGLWTIADRAGRLEDRAPKIKAQLLPYDDCDVNALLAELEAKQFIARYAASGGKYIEVLNFAKHQNPHVREPESTIPAPGLNGAKHRPRTRRAPVEAGTGPADSLLLIPDSPSLIPESKTLASRPNGRSAGPVVATVPSNTGEEVPLYKAFVDELEKAYPDVDIPGTIAEIRAWCAANPTRRKTKGGMARFVNSWFARVQNA